MNKPNFGIKKSTLSRGQINLTTAHILNMILFIAVNGSFHRVILCKKDSGIIYKLNRGDGLSKNKLRSHYHHNRYYLLNRVNLPFLFIVFLAIFIFNTNVSYSAPITPADEQKSIRQQEDIKQRLERERQDTIQQKQLQEIENIKKGRLKEEEREELEKRFYDDGTCRVINEFVFTGNKKVSSRTLKRKFTNSYLKKCVTKGDLKDIQDNITEYYIKKGYISARVYFNTQRLLLGTMEFVIEEGKIENIKLNDNSKLNNFLPFRRKTQAFTAFPFKKNRVLNLRDIEQGLDQINRLSSQEATMQITPGNQAGYSDIVINNVIDNSTSLSFSVDNSGSETTGKRKRKLTLNQDNLLGLNDNIYVNYTHDDEPHGGEKYSESTYTALSIPFGYWTLGGSYSYSEYLTTTVGEVKTFKSSGNSESKSFYLDKVLTRGKNYKISLKAELEKTDTDTYIEDAFLPVSSRELSIGNIYLNNTVYTKYGTLFIRPQYIKGLDWFSEHEDEANLDNSYPKAQYNAYKLYGYFNTNFNIPKTEFPLNYQLTFDSQYSEDALYSSEQFSIGGQYTVRGFQESSISGDNGYYLRNDLKINVYNLLPNSLKNSNLLNYGNSKNLSVGNALTRTYLTAFYDYGYVRNKVIDESMGDEGYMSGTGVKLSYGGEYLDWYLTYARGLHSPRYLIEVEEIPEDKETIYFNISLKLGLA